jgi:hypothetical protein
LWVCKKPLRGEWGLFEEDCFSYLKAKATKDYV